MPTGQECPAGAFSDTTNAADCTACDGVTGYSPLPGSTSCLPVRSPCTSGQVQSQAPSPTQNRECRTCGEGDTYQDDPLATDCKPATICQAGEYVVTQVTPSSDRVCGGAYNAPALPCHAIPPGVVPATLASVTPAPLLASITPTTIAGFGHPPLPLLASYLSGCLVGACKYQLRWGLPTFCADNVIFNQQHTLMGTYDVFANFIASPTCVL